MDSWEDCVMYVPVEVQDISFVCLLWNWESKIIRAQCLAILQVVQSILKQNHTQVTGKDRKYRLCINPLLLAVTSTRSSRENIFSDSASK